MGPFGTVKERTQRPQGKSRDLRDGRAELLIYHNEKQRDLETKNPRKPLNLFTLLGFSLTPEPPVKYVLIIKQKIGKLPTLRLAKKLQRSKRERDGKTRLLVTEDQNSYCY